MQKGNICPLINKKCIEHKCAWYGQVRGVNPNTGQEVDEWQCVVNLLPMLLMENSKQQRSTSAAVESFRNETVKQGDVHNNLLVHSMNLTQQSLQAVTPSDIRILPSDQ